MTISQGVIIFLNDDNRIRHKLVLGKSKVAVLAYVVKKTPLNSFENSMNEQKGMKQ